MTPDEIITLAKQVGVEATGNEYWPFFIEELMDFAKLVAEAEREACAKLVEPDEEHRRDARWGYLGGEEGVELLDAKVAAIRARGQA